MNTKKKSARFGRIGLEVFSIVFAVLLALGLDSWQERAKREQKIDQALEDITQEVYSFGNFEIAIAYNQKGLDTLNLNIQKHEAGKPATFDIGMGRPEIKSLAWTTAQSTGIASEIERTLLLELAEIYSEYDRLDNILNTHAKFMLESDPEMPLFTQARHLERHLRLSIFRMKELSKKANLFLEKHKDKPFVKALD